MKLENAELKHIDKIVAISKAAFDSDINVGASDSDRPPDYDSIPWHVQMQNEGHLFQAVIDEEIVGGAILFLNKDGETLYIGSQPYFESAITPKPQPETSTLT